MLPQLALAVLAATCALAAPAAAPQPQPQPPAPAPPPSPAPAAAPLIPLASPMGQALLFTAWHSADFGPLAQAYVTQDNLAYCGVASAVMALNSLSVPAPSSPQHTFGNVSYAYWTQANFFDANETRAVMHAEDVAGGGMTLAQLSALLASKGLDAAPTYASGVTLPEFRALLVTNLASPGDRVLVNYQRSEVGQARGGHISPAAAYSKLTDRVLVLDTARYRYPAAWVAVADLWRGAQAVDSASGRSRGLVRVAAKGGGPGAAGPAAAAGQEGVGATIQSLVASLLGRR